MTRTKRNAFLRYRMVRPNTIFQPLQTAHFITRNYKKVAQAARAFWQGLCKRCKPRMQRPLPAVGYGQLLQPLH